MGLAHACKEFATNTKLMGPKIFQMEFVIILYLKYFVYCPCHFYSRKNESVASYVNVVGQSKHLTTKAAFLNSVC